MLIEKIRELFKHSAVYSIGWVASSAASILLLPVYTRYLSKADYGILEILTHFNGIFRIIMIAGLHLAVSRFYNFAVDGSSKRRVLSTANSAIFIIVILGSIFIFPLDDFLSNLILGSADYAYYVDINIIILSLDVMYFVFLISFIVQKKSVPYVAISMIKLILGIIANIYFIVFLKLGALGMLYGNVVSFLVTTVIAGFYSIRENGLLVDFPLLKEMLKFGLPLVPAQLCATVMHNADRFLIRYYCNLEDVGLYSLGYNFPMMTNVLLLQSFNMIWGASMMYEIAKEKDASYQFGRITTYFMLLFVSTQYALSIYSTTVVKILAAPKFFMAHTVIPFVSLGVCLHAFYTFFTVGAFIKKKTWLVNIGYLPAAILNIALNMVLLPRFGYIAAAWTTVFTYFTFVALVYVACRKTISISFEFKRLSYVFLTTIALYIVSSQLFFDNLLIDFSLQSLFILIYAALIYFGNFFTDGEKNVVRQEFKKAFTKISIYRKADL